MASNRDSRPQGDLEAVSSALWGLVLVCFQLMVGVLKVGWLLVRLPADLAEWNAKKGKKNGDDRRFYERKKFS